ncbi:MAG TPA: ATPase F0F1 [candidate division Zixibacteria bacterium]|nr:ATPase F0F1 [candidate division Zixibacteria bacterium]HEQ97739.1 ATPase F0F1 [candidate division Zixibacteria bacterium]
MSGKFGEKISKKEKRKLKARREKDKSGLWFWLGMFGMVGWSVAIPTIVCLAIGIWIDSTHPGQISWTLTFLVIGVVLGSLNAWYWIKRESRHD